MANHLVTCSEIATISGFKMEYSKCLMSCTEKR
nr:MAG TPA: hypothetical protein [Caudoviricetes sp.]